jgi:hypothetical protein
MAIGFYSQEHTTSLRDEIEVFFYSYNVLTGRISSAVVQKLCHDFHQLVSGGNFFTPTHSIPLVHVSCFCNAEEIFLPSNIMYSKIVF